MEEGTNFCTSNWCTTETSSIFTYPDGDDHGTYDLCDAVYASPVLPARVPATVIEVRRRASLSGGVNCKNQTRRWHLNDTIHFTFGCSNTVRCHV